jgi:predicted nucleic acid-binding Zn ribbon protein
MGIMTATGLRACARDGCGQPVTGRADKRFCSDSCRALVSYSRNASRKAKAQVTASSTAAITPIRPDVAPVWDPAGQPQRPYLTAESCPDCGVTLYASPRGTIRVCAACRKQITPAAVLAPYERGDAAAVRVVKSQAERDLEAIALARRKGTMLIQLGALADDDRLDPASLPVVDWFRDEVKDARSGVRLDELDELLPQAGIRRRRWWQGQPAVQAPEWDEDDDEDQAVDAGRYPQAIEAAPLAVVAQRREMTAADALDVLGWRLTPTTGGCQVVKGESLCGAETRQLLSGRWVREAYVCNPCYRAVCKVIHDAERSA